MATVATTPTRDHSSTLAQADVAEKVRAAFEARRAIYPAGGCTALDYGCSPTKPEEHLDLTGLNRIVDYTPRDMTILVEAGVRMVDLSAALASEGQHLPIDVPRAREATIGGVVASNWSGPRRYGYGTIRDYVIGIHAVDGRGVAFKGGGRVVKNVAGYDFCKLLTGSLGTLGVITQLALKVKPRAETSTAVLAQCNDLAAAETMLSRVANLAASPVAIDLLAGATWNLGNDNRKSLAIVVRMDGTEQEVNWLAEQVRHELTDSGSVGARRLDATDDNTLWARQVEFSDTCVGGVDGESPLVVKIAVLPSGVTKLAAALLEFDPQCAIQAHAGNGVIYARFSRFSHGELTSVLVGKLRPMAMQSGGSLVILSSKLDGLTPHLIWGGRSEATVLMEHIKQKFDPHNILNPGRFVF